MNLNENERRKIAEAINENLEAYCSNFDSIKYPEEPYIKWKKAFANPCINNQKYIKEAFEWKYGHWGKKNYPESHKTIISKFYDNWEEFVENNNFDMKDIFDYWEKVLKDHQNFVTIAFITHLIHNKNIPLIDQHTFRAMNYILSKVKNNSFSENKPCCIDDLKMYTDFFNSIVPLISTEEDKRRVLDKFLMCLGQSIKKKDNSSRTKISTSYYEIEVYDSKVFRTDKISITANADRLFVQFLESIENEYGSNYHDEFSIGEVVKRIPLNNSGIKSPTTYYFSVLGMLSGQRERDYFIFDKPDLKLLFTEQTNNPKRNNKIWINYLIEIVRINPKYIMS